MRRLVGSLGPRQWSLVKVQAEMAIRPGEEWGTSFDGVETAPLCVTDLEVGAVISAGGEPLVRGGDLHRAVGAPQQGEATRRLPIDLMIVRDLATGTEVGRAVSTVIIRRRSLLGWLRGPVTVIGNVEFVRGRQVLPRAHPNDGLLDRIDVDGGMSARQRIYALSRSRVGNHLPHPGLSVSRGERFTLRVESGCHALLDGRAVELRDQVVVEVAPDGGHILA